MWSVSHFRTSTSNQPLQFELYMLDVTSNEHKTSLIVLSFSVRPTLLILETTSGWLAFKTVPRFFWAKILVILANWRTRWVSSLSASQPLFFPPVFPIRVLHESVASRIGPCITKMLWEAAHCEWIGVLFVAFMKCAFKAQGFLTRSYSSEAHSVSHGVVYIKRQT